MNEIQKHSAKRVQETLDRFNLALTVVELPDSTRSAREAAQAIGCTVSQIAKSLVFKTASTHQPVLIIASGTNRVNEKTVKNILGEAIQKADAAFARDHTGYAIGGVPPIGHIKPLRTLIDQDLLELDLIWAAAGTPNAVFQLHPQDLVTMTGGTVAKIT